MVRSRRRHNRSRLIPTPAPSVDENASPVYGIRTPKPGARAYLLGTLLGHTAADIETVLGEFGLPPVLSGTPIVASSSAARNAHWGTPANATQRLALQNLGAITVRTDLGWTEQYFAGLTDGGSNPAGVAVAGWYPILGKLPTAQRERNASAWSFPNNADTKLDSTYFTNELVRGVTVDAGSGNFTITQAGRYRIFNYLTFLNSAGGGTRRVRVNRNSTTSTVNSLLYAADPGLDTAIGTTGTEVKKTLALNDELRFWGFQNSGSTLSLVTASDQAVGSFFGVEYIGPA